MFGRFVESLASGWTRHVSYGPAVMVSWAIGGALRAQGSLERRTRDASRGEQRRGQGEPGCLQWRQAGPPAGLGPRLRGVPGMEANLETPGSEWG